MISIKKKEEIVTLKTAGKILVDVFVELARLTKPGLNTLVLNETAERIIRKSGAEPSFLGYESSFADSPYPATLCVSLNEYVVHGIPSKALEIADGDLVSLDCGLKLEGLFVDAAISFISGTNNDEARKLLQSVWSSLKEGEGQCFAGNHLGNVGAAISAKIEKDGFAVIRDLAGHGVGYAVHEPPLVLNYGQRGEGEELKKGMVLAIEPMACLGKSAIVVDYDGWSIRTADKSLSAHFEETIAISDHGPEVLTPLESLVRELIF